MTLLKIFQKNQNHLKHEWAQEEAPESLQNDHKSNQKPKQSAQKLNLEFQCKITKSK